MYHVFLSCCFSGGRKNLHIRLAMMHSSRLDVLHINSHGSSSDRLAENLTETA